MNRTAPIALLLSACAPAMPELAPLAPDLSSAPASTWADVGPILEQRCVTCHQEGSSGPFRLDTYELAEPWAAAIAAATAARTMPPFLVRGDGTCGEYADNHWLSDEELLTLRGWADAGAPEGDGYTLTAPSPPGLQGETLDQQRGRGLGGAPARGGAAPGGGGHDGAEGGASGRAGGHSGPPGLALGA